MKAEPALGVPPQMISATEVAQWLVAIGYGYDFQSTIPLPELLRRPLAEAWRNADGGDDLPDSVDDYMNGLEAEGVW